MSEGWMEWDGLGRSMEFGVVRILGGLQVDCGVGER